MKLFRDKNRGPKIKSEDVVIPEEYLEYEREAEARKRHAVQEERIISEQESTEDESDDPIAIRVEQLLNTSKKTLQEQAAQKEKPIPDVTIEEVVDTLEEMLPSKEETADAAANDDEETISLEEALRAEKQRSNRAAKKARRQPKKKGSVKNG